MVEDDLTRREFEIEVADFLIEDIDAITDNRSAFIERAIIAELDPASPQNRQQKLSNPLNQQSSD